MSDLTNERVREWMDRWGGCAPNGDVVMELARALLELRRAADAVLTSAACDLWGAPSDTWHCHSDQLCGPLDGLAAALRDEP